MWEEHSRSGFPKSSAEIRRVFIHDIKEVESVRQYEQQNVQRDEKEGDAVKHSHGTHEVCR